MSFKKSFARFLLVNCRLKQLHGGRIQKTTRAFLDEIDFQNFRETYPCPAVQDRDELFRLAHAAVQPASPIIYLEFGVYAGKSIKAWTLMNKDSQSRFYGFDSFSGLPEDWNQEKGKGHFDVNGAIPQIADPRVTFVKGWFDDTVPSFVKDFNPKHRLVIHFDADLYSSTLLPLFHLHPFTTKGTLLMFDEFYDRDHEFKALLDYQKLAKKKFRSVCQLDNFSKVCLEIV